MRLPTMTEYSVQIGFGNSLILVRSNALEVVDELVHNFRAMLTTEFDDPPLAQLSVWKCNKNYYLESSKAKIETSLLANILRHLRDEIVLQIIQAHSHLLWLHGGAVVYQNSGVLVSGLSGQGKSTLVANLLAQGWRYLSDDVTPYEPESGRAIPFPETPAVRHHSRQELSIDQARALPKSQIELNANNICNQAVPIKAVIFPAYHYHGAMQLQQCSPATAALELLQNSLNFVDHQDSAVSYLCELVSRVPVYRLFYSDGNQAAQQITRLFG